MKKTSLIVCLAMALACTNVTSLAQKAPVIDTAKKDMPKADKFIARHAIRIDNKIINYTATVGTLVIKNEKDEPCATMGYTAYTKDGETAQGTRPVVFAYNGGPGSSSVYLHMGILGPRKVIQSGTMAPFKLEDNNNTLLDVADIVLIDPVGTGFSRPAGKAKFSDFWGVDQDIKSVSLFIKYFITEYEKWSAPKFLMGESYGTLRSAGVAYYLQDNFAISLNGIVLVSNVLDMRTLGHSPGDDISYIVKLPTYAATAWYHNKLKNRPADLYAFLKEAREYAFGEYASALMKGDQLPAPEREMELEKLSSFTGLSKEYLDKADLRVKQSQFCQELLRDSGMCVGRLDSRYTGIIQNLLSENSFFDPNASETSPAFVSGLMTYLTSDLKVPKDKIYNIDAYAYPDFNWDWKRKGIPGMSLGVIPPSTAPDLSLAMTIDPELKVLVLNGVYDLATPFGATEYTLAHMGLSRKLKDNIILKYYEAGHMMYTHDESAAKFKKDVVDFMNYCLKQFTVPKARM